jgi:AcrR family transcriptional regulator
MSTHRQPGRPRDPAVDTAILDVAARLLAEQGYARMSIALVADAAGVSRPAIYRRFKTKADLAMAALAARIDKQARPPSDLDVETALIQVLRNLAHRLRAKHSMALIGTLLVEEEQTPELIRLFRERLWAARADLLQEILDRGRERAELHNTVDSEVVVGMLIGALYAAHLSLAKIPRDWPARVVRAALEGMR